MTEELPLCACGCGERVSKAGSKWRRGHNARKPSPKTLKNMSKAQTKRYEDPKEHEKTKKSALQEKEPLSDGWDTKKLLLNKNCSTYLGNIAEQLLSKIFKNVQVMPNCNPGFDFICGSGYKIDVKSAATGNKDNGWIFPIRKNKIPDYFLLIGFDNRKDLNPVYLWLIPGYIINHLIGLKISKIKSNLQKWAKYEQPLNKVIACCNEMKNDNQKLYKV